MSERIRSGLNLRQCLRFLAGLSVGSLPTQSQLSKILEAISASEVFLDSDRCSSSDLNLIISSLSQLLNALRDFTNQKNAQNQIQRLIYLMVNSKLDPIIHQPNSNSQDHRLPTTQELIHSILNLITLSFSSQAFRSLLNSSFELIHQIIHHQQQEHLDSIHHSQPLIDQFSRSALVLIFEFKSQLGLQLTHTLSQIIFFILDDLSNYQHQLSQQTQIAEICEVAFECLCGFTGHQPWSEFKHEVNQLIQEIKTNQELNHIKNEINHLFYESIQSPELVYSPEFHRRFQSILIRFWNSKPELLQSISKLMKILDQIRIQIIQDQSSLNLIQALNQLLSHFHQIELGTSIHQSIDFKKLGIQLWNKLLIYLIPKLLNMVQEIPLPRIEFVSREIDFAIDPLSLRSTTGFMPNLIRFNHHSQIEFKHLTPQTTSETHSNTTSTRFTQTVIINGLRLFTKDVGFYFKKKRDPKSSLITQWFSTEFEDEGLLDLFIGMGTDDGINCSFEIEMGDGLREQESQSTRFFKLKKTHVDVQGFGIYPHHSTHPVLNWLLKPGLALYLQNTLANTIQEYLEHQLLIFEDLMSTLKARYTSTTPSPSRAQEEEIDPELETRTRIDGTGLRIEPKDQSYVLMIGMGDRLLKGKGIGGIKGLDRIKQIANQTVGEVEDLIRDSLEGVQTEINQVTETVKIGKQMGSQTQSHGQNGWQSDVFDLDI